MKTIFPKETTSKYPHIFKQLFMRNYKISTQIIFMYYI